MIQGLISLTLQRQTPSLPQGRPGEIGEVEIGAQCLSGEVERSRGSYTMN